MHRVNLCRGGKGASQRNVYSLVKLCFALGGTAFAGRIHLVAVQCTEEARRLCGIRCRQTGLTRSGQSIACWVMNGAALRHLGGCIWLGYALTCPLGLEGY